MYKVIVLGIMTAWLGAGPAFGEASDAPFWRRVQATCTQTAAQPTSQVATRIAQSAIAEFERFGGHKIDSDGRLFHFGVVESEQEQDDQGDKAARLGQLAWWQVLKYWRTLRGSNAEAAARLDVWAYQGAAADTDADRTARLLKFKLAKLIDIIDASAAGPDEKEALKEAVIRAAINDNAWSAAFVSSIMASAGLTESQFTFASAHQRYIYNSFRASAAEVNNQTTEHVYRACPVYSTKPRVGDLLCYQRERKLANATDAEVRATILSELERAPQERSVSKTHCDIVVHVDARARKVYVIGGNVYQSVTVKKLNLRRDLALSTAQSPPCPHWTLPKAKGTSTSKETPNGPVATNHIAPSKCSLNDKTWFVLLQMR
jgi:hypothetical protein